MIPPQNVTAMLFEEAWFGFPKSDNKYLCQIVNGTLMPDYEIDESYGIKIISIFTCLHALVFMLGIPVFVVGIGMCSETLTRSEFGIYLILTFITSIPLLLISFGKFLGFYQDFSMGMFRDIPDPSLCFHLTPLYYYIDYTHVFSIQALCVHSIRSQRIHNDMHPTTTEAMRSPIMVIGLAVIAMLWIEYPYFKYDLLGTLTNKCLSTLMSPCGYSFRAVSRGYLPLAVDICGFAQISVLLVEIFLKKRRWKRHVKEWDKKRSIQDLSFDDLDMEFIRRDSKNVRKVEGQLLLGRRNTMILSKKAVFQSSTVITSTLTNTVLEPDREFYLHENLPGNTPLGHKTLISLTVVVTNIFSRLLRDILRAPEMRQWLRTTFKGNNYDLIIMLSVTILPAMGEIIAVFILCAINSPFLAAAKHWLFKDSSYSSTIITKEILEDIIETLHRRPTTVFQQNAWFDQEQDLNMIPGIERTEETLSGNMATTCRQLHIFDILEAATGEPIYIETFEEEDEMGSHINHGSVSIVQDSGTDDESGKGSTLTDFDSQDLLQEGGLIGRRSTLIHAQSHKFFQSRSNTNSVSRITDSI